MAVQTKPVARISTHGVVLFEAFMEYHDDDYQEINDDGDPDDFRVIRWYGTNHAAYPMTVSTFRPNGMSRWTRTVAAGADWSVNSGGGVKYESDIPRWVFG